MVSVMLGLAVAGYGIAGSYETLSELAARKGLPLPGLVPLGIDGGFVGVVALDLVLTWAGQPIGWLRQVARALTVGTVAANAAAGWPDPVAVGLHTAAPAMLLVMVEAARAVLLRRMGRANGTARDSIPLLRWVLAPWRTCLLWRRMVLWQVASYRQAVEAELELRRATTLLRDRFGRRWRRAAPTDLVWMLQTGVSAFEACGRVRELVTGCDQGLGGGDAENSGLNHHPAIEVSDPMAMGHRGDGSMRDERFQDAVRLNADHWARWGRPISAESLRKELRIGASKARALARAARAADAAAIRAAAPITPT
ncbi:DUF2637 domain-containing protein [Prauserella muralis]|uniref:DUF2637 domain-containing protein n=1 Tax=Prauserella muralis TaxID=588067 RepID=UPI001476006C|nr:DUF2637 domain-containing protein [Prauserella muralis]